MYIRIYGQKRSSVFNVWSTLIKEEAIVYLYCRSTASENAPLQYLAPYRVCHGEYFVIEDNLLNCLWRSNKHAAAYRQMSLLCADPRTRSLSRWHLLSSFAVIRTCCKLNDNFGGGSLTALPMLKHKLVTLVVIPTNIISILMVKFSRKRIV